MAFLLIGVEAQHPPCYPDYSGLTLEYTKPIVSLALFSDMPLDVMVGYIVLDSICKHTTSAELFEFLDHQSFNDTIKMIRKIYYNMLDYNPFLLLAVTRNYDTAFSIFPYQVISTLKQILGAKSPPTGFKYGYPVLTAGIIAHIRVINTVPILDTSAHFAKNEIVVNCEVIDTIKGRVLPFCKSIGYSNQIKNNNLDNSLNYVPDELQPNIPGSCLQFKYRLEWTRGKNSLSPYCSKNMTDSLGLPLIKANTEYIVFLEPSLTCDNGNKYYYSLAPLGLKSEMFTLYPIINGLVIDEGNDFGFGCILTPLQFKANIRDLINKINNY